jgi:murein DD-endopeptidase MepM/ murein hydrolase activator NlpD
MSPASAADGTPLDDTHPGSARVAEERLLGSGDEDVRFLACQPFTREIAAAGVVADSLDASLSAAGVPAAAMLEARQAFAAAINFERDVQSGDRFHVRYQQTFTAEGAPIGVGRVMWAELRTKANGTISLHRFRPLGGAEQFWLAGGEAATPPSIRLPLDTVTVSSGYGLRADPLDKPSGKALAMGPLPDPASAPAAAAVAAPAPPQPVAAPQPEQAKPAVRNAVRGGLSTGQFGFGGPASTHLDPNRLERLVAERDAQARRTAAAPSAAPSDAARATEVAAAAPRPAPRAHRLFMHDGVDLVAETGTPIYAAADGVVAGAALNGGYGNWIRIDHPGKLSTVYGHLSDFALGIEEGVHVSQGELIGFVGNTGRSTGSHLHFEIVSNGKTVNPLVHPELKRAQLRGADLERFREQVKLALAERDREAAAELAACGF